MSHDDGESPITRDEARERVAKWFNREEHKKPKPGKNEPREDDLNDPDKQEKGDEE